MPKPTPEQIGRAANVMGDETHLSRIAIKVAAHYEVALAERDARIAELEARCEQEYERGRADGARLKTVRTQTQPIPEFDPDA